ncbi:MAG: 50S ribosomal protein L18 [Deltaproteobacteria bacterium]|nr:50S ribosomal protein L18 [Deltaproteobacteria bacterium]
MSSLNEKKLGHIKRKKRIRKKIYGTSERPRLCVFRSAQHIYAQLINDTIGATLASTSTLEKIFLQHPDIQDKKNKGKKIEADIVGQIIGKSALEKGIKKVVFDRNGFLYHGRVKAVSEGARKAGLDF